MSYPALRAAKVDPGLKRLFLAELVTQALNEGMEVIIPEGTAMRIISRDTFQKYKETVSGLIAGDTQREVLNKLVQLGLATTYRPPQDPST